MSGPSSGGLRVVLVGATGALGQEVRNVLEGSSLPIASLSPVATERSIGAELEFRGDLVYVESELPALRSVDLLILCAPPAASLELIRDALRAEVPCIDCSGALLASPDVPLVMLDRSPAAELIAPVVGTPSGVALAWARVLSALESVAGVERVVGTVLHPAAHAGRRGIETLSAETIALLSQAETPDPVVFPAPIAFDCVSAVRAEGEGSELAGEPLNEGGATSLEAGLRAELTRLVGDALQVAVTAIQVPTFVGEGMSLAVETRQPLSVDDAMAVLEKTEGVELWGSGEGVPSTRDTAGRDEVLVGRVRRDPTRENGLLLWMATDGLRLVAAEVVGLAERRLRLN